MKSLVYILLSGVVIMSASTNRSFGGDAANAREFLVYVGTYTGPKTKSKGIYVCRFDATTGKLTAPDLAAETANPSFLAIHPNQKFLYSVGEMSNFEGKKSGAVSAFAIDPKTGKLTLLNQVASGGVGPCHVSLDKTGKCALVANYSSGSVAAIPIQADGRLGEPASVMQHEGSSIDPGRQKGPHAHSINLSPDNRFAFAADLGLDKVLIYRLDPDKATLSVNDPPFAAVKPGSGPRHFAFHPSAKFAYVINEMGNTVTAFAYDASRGALKEIQMISTIPAGYTAETYTSEVQVSPDGRFLYGSNRGHHSIAVFTISQDTGLLTLVEIPSCGGEWPRNFAIAPNGAYMLVGNEHSHTIALFKIAATTGKLTPPGDTIPCPAPVCLKFLPVQ